MDCPLEGDAVVLVSVNPFFKKISPQNRSVLSTLLIIGCLLSNKAQWFNKQHACVRLYLSFSIFLYICQWLSNNLCFRIWIKETDMATTTFWHYLRCYEPFLQLPRCWFSSNFFLRDAKAFNVYGVEWRDWSSWSLI